MTESTTQQVADAAAERKRKRLEAWRKRQEEQQASSNNASVNNVNTTNTTTSPTVATTSNNTISTTSAKKVSISLVLGGVGNSVNKNVKPKKKKRKQILHNVIEDNDNNNDNDTNKNDKSKINPSFDLEMNKDDSMVNNNNTNNKKISRWDNKTPNITLNNEKDSDGSNTMSNNKNIGKDESDTMVDDLDKYMDELVASTKIQPISPNKQLQQPSLSPLNNHSNRIGIDGVDRKSTYDNYDPQSSRMNVSLDVPLSGGVITPEELAKLHGQNGNDDQNDANDMEIDTALESDPNNDKTTDSKDNKYDNDNDDDEEEEKARRAFLEALKNVKPIPTTSNNDLLTTTSLSSGAPPQLASEVKSEKQRREERLRSLQQEAENALKASSKAAQPDIGRIYYDDVESGVMEEAQRTLNVLNDATQDNALEVLAELNKKKELKAVDHSSVEYIPIRKNLYIVPRSLASLTSDDIADRRAKLGIKVRGKGAPAPVSSFAECGISERIIDILSKMGVREPFPVQAQCLPCIMAGRDVIGIAKTGSGKTLAYLLPMLRHISDQPPLAPHESGPIGLVLAPARELAVQIANVTKVFAKHLGIKSTAVYGGAGVAEQIADLKRGTYIATATPGRMIDILTMQSGKILSLQRVSYVVMDEADRMFDMGFAPQISAILSAVRPDRQTVLFSATFPKAVEALARKSLKFPIEVLVGGRSVASDSVSQYGELIEEEDKFLRLLQLLGEYVVDDKKVIVFVDTQSRADSVFEQLIRCGYPSLSLHGGKEQEDRDSTISDFKRSDGPNVLVATSVAGRGLDVPSCCCVINYAAPNHLEDYVHRVGRTGRAGNKGVSYTFVNSGDEAKFAPIVVRAMIEAGQSENISSELRKLSDEYKVKVERGEARYAGSGFKGKGYSYDSSELSESQKLARLEKRQALIEAGMIDDDDDMNMDMGQGDDEIFDERGDEVKTRPVGESTQFKEASGFEAAANFQANLSADILALPGMREAIMRKAGIEPPTSQLDALTGGNASGNHFVEEIEINDYPREARWKVTQKETTSRLQDEFQTAVTLKGKYIAPNTQPEEGERKLYLHLEATTERILQTCIQEIRRLLNEETLRVGLRGAGGSHRYNVLG